MMRRLYIFIFLIVAAVALKAQAPSGYYDAASGKTGEELRAALHDIIKDHTTISYQNIWNAFANTDNKGSNVVWDMYSDGGGYTYYYNSNPSNQCGTYEQEGDCFNREHTWPKNWFNGDETTVVGRDLHQIFPTDGFVNAQRGNFPFGEVNNATWTSQNGSKLGTCKSSLGYSNTVFEPIDEYKGDFARALMYVSVRYYDEDSDWGTSGMTDKSDLKSWAVAMLLDWHRNDPVSDKERARNNAIYNTYQHNRNPFIDYPDYAEMIWNPNWSESYQIYATANPTIGGEASVTTTVTETVAIDFSQQGYSNAQVITGANIDDNVSVAFNKGSGTTSPTYYNNGTSVRCYAKNNFVVSTMSGVITKIVLTYGTDDGNNTITANPGTFNTNTWTGSSSSVTFTLGDSGQRRIKAIEVTYNYEGTPAQQATCAYGSVATLTATASTGYHFVNWTKGGTEVSTDETFSFNVSENATYQANFEINTYTVSVAANTGGTAFIGDAPSPSTTVSINFSQQGYTNAQDITDVEVDDNIILTFGKGNNSQSSPKYYTSDASVRCYAKNTIVVSKKANSNVSITSITLSFASYSPAATITPNVGALSGATWSGNSSSVTFTLGDSGQRRFTQMSITYSGGAPATVATFNHGATATVTAVPASGYSFVNWTTNNEPTSADVSYSFTVTEAGTYTANFTSNTVSESTSIPSLTLAENVTFTINPNIILTVDGPIAQASGAKIIIEDGGQLINGTADISAIVKKNITTWNEGSKTGWQAISTPVDNVAFADVANLTSSAYNVYRLNETNMMWENSQNPNNLFNSFENGRGYLYRKGDNTAIQLDGTLNVSSVTYPLTYTSSTTKGFHLVGNPYPHNIYKGAGAAIPNTYLEEGFYTLTSAGGWLAGYDHTTAIAPNQAILVQALSTVSNNDLIITKTTSPGTTKGADDNIKFVVSNSNYHDVAYAVFKDGHGLNKIEHRNDDIQMLYIEHNGEDFAIADFAEDERAFNLKFHAATTGIYTMKVQSHGDFSYLHLIDRITGNDVDMLVEDEYSFVATSQDSDSRFIVKLEFVGSSAESENTIFAYQSGDEIVVEGEGELQIFDVMGRMVAKRYVTGVEIQNLVSLQKGVYIFRLIGAETKTQKIVVK